MGRHTGDYLLGAVFVGAAVLLALLHSTTESAILPHRGGFQVVSDVATDTATRESCPDRRFNSGITTPVAIIRDIRPGARIVLGSLDVSGARHQIRIKMGSNDAAPKTPEDAIPVCRFSAREVRPFDRPDLEIRPDMSDTSISIQTCECPPSMARTSHTPFSALASRHRVFLTPHFHDNGASHEAVECQMVGESKATHVYVDRRLSKEAHPELFCTATFKRLSVAVENRALPIVECWIGAIADVDDDRKLSIVITDLDRQSQTTIDRPPIHGCIRELDFHPDASFCGDIVYVDPAIFDVSVEELAALLTHELTHAAMCSRQIEHPRSSRDPLNPHSLPTANSVVPAWMNEAVAHLVELNCSPQSPNFHRRINSFEQDTSRCPIVADESVLSLQERRGGSRFASTLFLAQFLSSPRQVQRLLESTELSLDRRIASVTDCPFDEVFRNWTLSMAATNTVDLAIRGRLLPNASNASEFSLCGTAFVCIECPAESTSLLIEADPAARLQISVLE